MATMPFFSRRWPADIPTPGNANSKCNPNLPNSGEESDGRKRKNSEQSKGWAGISVASQFSGGAIEAPLPHAPRIHMDEI
jgi:hypothetical protein